MHINNDTIPLGVIGDPIAHSLSPKMQNFMIEKIKQNYIYFPFHIPKGAFKQFLDAAKLLQIQGFNVTMPHKEDAFATVDMVLGDAQKAGSVNTVCFREGKSYGYSTDGEGFRLALAERQTSFENKKVLFIGAGGAAKAIGVTAEKNNATEIIVLSRSVEKAEQVIEDFQNGVADVLNDKSLKKYSAEADILIQCTPLGMHGMAQQFEDLSFLETAPKVVADLIYSPSETLFLQKAKEQGHLIFNGLDMLIYQGILSLALFTDTAIEPFEMKSQVAQFLAEEIEKCTK